MKNTIWFADFCNHLKKNDYGKISSLFILVKTHFKNDDQK